jgi:phospholipid/cholesterol/gamma-HCH transport system ATP-binding protein
MKESSTPIIEVSGLKTYIGGRLLHNDINFSVRKGEIIAIIGGSGCGKTTLLRSLLMLLKPATGRVKIFGTDIYHCTSEKALQVRKRWGVLFQNNALFSSLTLLENVLFPLQEYTRFAADVQRNVAMIKITLTGLEPEAAIKYPAELSGGMQKRGALARAIALDPELLFLDEPTTGLDPNSAGDLDQLILKLRDHFGFTIVIVTHDLDTLWTVPDRVVFLGDGRVLAAAAMEDLIQQKHPLIQDYFSGERAQMAKRSIQENSNHGY